MADKVRSASSARAVGPTSSISASCKAILWSRSRRSAAATRRGSTSLREQYGIARTYTDYRALLADTSLDGVIIATPDDEHLPMALAAIDAGLDVLCEKPLANTAADARRMLDAAEAKGVKHMVMFTWRWQPHYQYVKSLIDDGAFGRSTGRSSRSSPALRSTGTTSGGWIPGAPTASWAISART